MGDIKTQIAEIDEILKNDYVPEKVKIALRKKRESLVDQGSGDPSPKTEPKPKPKRPKIVAELEEWAEKQQGGGYTFSWQPPNTIMIGAGEGAITRNIGGHFRDFGEVYYDETLRKSGEGDDEFYLTLTIDDKFLEDKPEPKKPTQKLPVRLSQLKKWFEKNKGETIYLVSRHGELVNQPRKIHAVQTLNFSFKTNDDKEVWAN
jgi:hypothetical protein